MWSKILTRYLALFPQKFPTYLAICVDFIWCCAKCEKVYLFLSPPLQKCLAASCSTHKNNYPVLSTYSRTQCYGNPHFKCILPFCARPRPNGAMFWLGVHVVLNFVPSVTTTFHCRTKHSLQCFEILYPVRVSHIGGFLGC